MLLTVLSPISRPCAVRNVGCLGETSLWFFLSSSKWSLRFLTNCFIAGGKSFPCNDIAMILLWVSSMVVGIDIDARVYMGESSRSRNCPIKSYEKPYSRWREIRACNDNACKESKSQNSYDSLL